MNMKRILSLLVATLFAGIGTAATAQNVTADPPAAGTQAIAPTDAGTVTDKTAGNDVPADSARANAAAQADSKAEYAAAEDKAQRRYTDAKVKCDSLEGNAMSTCVADAGTARTAALAQAKTQWETQGKTDESSAAKPAADGMGNPDPSLKYTQ
jgi:Skp family chaperone for outer membrane proteins